MGCQTVDILYGSGFLNYINGYVSKCTDCLDLRLSEHIRSEGNFTWRMVSSLICQQSPCMPEIYAQLASLQLMRRTFYVDAVYAPQEVSWTDEFSVKSNQQPRLGSDTWCTDAGSIPRVRREVEMRSQLGDDAFAADAHAHIAVDLEA